MAPVVGAGGSAAVRSAPARRESLATPVPCRCHRPGLRLCRTPFRRSCRSCLLLVRCHFSHFSERSPVHTIRGSGFTPHARTAGRGPLKGPAMAAKDLVRTEAAPAPFQGAPYSQAIRCGDLVFVSGQLALRPGSRELAGPTIQEQTEQVFANLRAILEAAGSGLDKLVKTTVFLANLDDFQGM